MGSEWRRWMAEQILRNSEPKKDGKETEKKEERKKDPPEDGQD